MLLLIRNCFGKKCTFRIVGGSHAVIGIAVFSIVFQSSSIDVEHRVAEAGKRSREETVSFIILFQGEWRGGQIEKNIDIFFGSQLRKACKVAFVIKLPVIREQRFNSIR